MAEKTVDVKIKVMMSNGARIQKNNLKSLDYMISFVTMDIIPALRPCNSADDCLFGEGEYIYDHYSTYEEEFVTFRYSKLNSSR